MSGPREDDTTQRWKPGTGEERGLDSTDSVSPYRDRAGRLRTSRSNPQSQPHENLLKTCSEDGILYFPSQPTEQFDSSGKHNDSIKSSNYRNSRLPRHSPDRSYRHSHDKRSQNKYQRSRSISPDQGGKKSVSRSTSKEESNGQKKLYKRSDQKKSYNRSPRRHRRSQSSSAGSKSSSSATSGSSPGSKEQYLSKSKACDSVAVDARNKALGKSKNDSSARPGSHSRRSLSSENPASRSSRTSTDSSDDESPRKLNRGRSEKSRHKQRSSSRSSGNSYSNRMSLESNESENENSRIPSVGTPVVDRSRQLPSSNNATYYRGTHFVPTHAPASLPFIKNDGSFLEMFKKMQESQKNQECAASTSVPESSGLEGKKPALPVVGKRRGGRVLKTGLVKKPKSIEEQTVDNTPTDAWSLYLKEVKKYKQSSCDEECKMRPLFK